MSEPFYFFALFIVLAWVFKVIIKRYSKKIVETGKPHPQSIAGFLHKQGQPLPSFLTGSEIIKLARTIARIGDLIFWIIFFSVLIFILFMWR